MPRRLFLFAALVVLGSQIVAPIFSQQDRATVTGTVTDPEALAIPGLEIQVRNTATNATYDTTTNDVGHYTVPNLPIGSYRITFQMPGFKTLVRDGIVLNVSQVARIDVQMQLGEVTDAVEVVAGAAALQTESPEVGTLLDRRRVIDLPLSFNGGRSPEAFAYAVTPGVQGDVWESRINGGPTFSKEVLLDGGSVSGYLAGDFSGAKPSVEAVEEFRVQTSGLSAEYGRTGGGVFNFVMKSGTNAWHGSAMALFRNESLNANSFSSNYYGIPRQRDRKHNWAVSGGGPILIPEIYDGRDKTFFYATFERYNEENRGLGSPSITVPLPEMWNGDLSRLLTNEVVGKDALGRDILRGAIYDPATTKYVGKTLVRDPFPNNIIPSHRISAVSRKLAEVMNKYYPPQVKDPDGRFSLIRNRFGPAYNQVFQKNHQFSLKVDHNVSNRQKLSAVFSYSERDRLLTDNSGNGLWTDEGETGGPLSGSEKNPYYGYLPRVSHDYTITPRLLNHFMVSANRIGSHHIATSKDEGGGGILGIKGVKQDGPWPVVTLGGSDRVNFATMGYAQQSLQFATVWQFNDTVSYVTGRHVIKIGADTRRTLFSTVKEEFPAGRFNFDREVTGLIGNPRVGHSFASMLLGEVRNADALQSMPTASQFQYLALFVQDDFKISPKFTLNLGLRWDYQPVQTEMYDRLYTFCTTCTDPQTGFPGAIEYTGKGPGRNGKRGFVDNRYNGFGPRLGLAYQITPKFVFRGGYGFFYVPRVPNDWAGVPYGSLMGLARQNFVPSPSAKGVAAFNWDSGYPGVEIPPDYNPSLANTKWGAVYWDPEGGKLPYVQQWNANFQYQLPGEIVIDLGYVGSKSTAIYANQLNQINQLKTDVLKFGDDLQNIWFNRSSDIPAEAKAMGARYPFPEGTKWISLQQSLQPFPQLPDWQGILAYNSPLGFATYHSMQLAFTKRYSAGLSWLANYTLSKTLSNIDTAFNTWDSNLGRPLDYYNLGLEKSIAPYDRTHVVKASLSYELPIGGGKWVGDSMPRALDLLFGGWVIQYLGNYQNGAPLGFSGTATPNFNAATNRAVIENPNGASLKVPFGSRNFDMSRISTPGTGEHKYVNTSLIRDPERFERGNAPFASSEIRGFPYYSEDFGLQKDFSVKLLGEGARFQLRADVLNAFNRHQFTGISTNPASLLFGQVTGVSADHRVIQVGMRLDW
ncbi:MAG: TonB-dependent receptor domain-containing protein [Acidobacteriota bacterium]